MHNARINLQRVAGAGAGAANAAPEPEPQNTASWVQDTRVPDAVPTGNHGRVTPQPPPPSPVNERAHNTATVPPLPAPQPDYMVHLQRCQEAAARLETYAVPGPVTFASCRQRSTAAGALLRESSALLRCLQAPGENADDGEYLDALQNLGASGLRRALADGFKVMSEVRIHAIDMEACRPLAAQIGSAQTGINVFALPAVQTMLTQMRLESPANAIVADRIQLLAETP